MIWLKTLIRRFVQRIHRYKFYGNSDHRRNDGDRHQQDDGVFDIECYFAALCGKFALFDLRADGFFLLDIYIFCLKQNAEHEKYNPEHSQYHAKRKPCPRRTEPLARLADSYRTKHDQRGDDHTVHKPTFE